MTAHRPDLAPAARRRRVLARGRRVHLRHPRPDDGARFLALVRASRALHGSWVSPPADPGAFLAWVDRADGERYQGLVVARRDDDDLVGVCNLSEIVRGAFQSAFLGYYVFAPHARQGLMSEGLALLKRYAFGTLRLHRLEANVQPENEASIALVRRVGFRKEGYSPRYLKIAGRWRDHERWAVLADG